MINFSNRAEALKKISMAKIVYEESNMDYNQFLDQYGATTVALPAPHGEFRALTHNGRGAPRPIDTSTEKPWKPSQYNRATGQWEERE